VRVLENPQGYGDDDMVRAVSPSISSDHNIRARPVNVADQDPCLDDIARQQVDDGVEDRGQTSGYNDISSWQLLTFSVEDGAC